jgi:hypothetical protein
MDVYPPKQDGGGNDASLDGPIGDSRIDGPLADQGSNPTGGNTGGVATVGSGGGGTGGGGGAGTGGGATGGGGGVDGGGGIDARVDVDAAEAGVVCPSSIAVASSDYVSTNVSVLSTSAAIVSETILSTASSKPGVTVPLGGDVLFPLTSMPGKIVLIDRYMKALVTWFDPQKGSGVQLSVATGFASNPHDYIEVSPNKAYISRYETNTTPGMQPYDSGGDLLVVDPTGPALKGNIPFAADADILPRPDRMIRIGNEVWVMLRRWDAAFGKVGDARLKGISTANDSVAWTLDLPGVADCWSMAVSPSRQVVAVTCAGIGSDSVPLSRSSIVLIDATAHPPVELRRIPVATQLGAHLGPSLAFASESLLVGTAFGGGTLGDGATRNDVGFSVDLSGGMAQVLFEGGPSFTLGDIVCSPGCTDLCLFADAKAKNLHVYSVNGTMLSARSPPPVDPTVGLPPRYITAF